MRIHVRRHTRIAAQVTAIASCGALIAACGASASGAGNDPSPAAAATQTGIAGDISSLCGHKDLTVAFVKGVGDDWTKVTLATLKNEAAKCPNIKRVLFADADGSVSNAISGINGLVAQGVNVMIVMPELGPAEIPALRAAEQAGVTVVTQIDNVGAVVNRDISAAVNPDMAAVGSEWAAWLNKVVGKGTVVFLGGPAGATSSLNLFDALTPALKRYPNLKLVVGNVVATDWNAGTAQQVMAGLLSKYGRIDAVVTDDGITAYGPLNAYKQAGMKLPALAAFASSNGTSCYWAANGRFPFMSVDGQSNLIRISLRDGLAIANGIRDPESTTPVLPVDIDTSAGKNPACDAALPSDAPLDSDLPLAQQQAALNTQIP